MDLSLSNVINVSVSQAPLGLAAFNTSNLALFSTGTPAGSFGSDGYKLYLEPTEVGVDFGTDSITYKMAVGIFSQTPNILLPGGYLVIIPFEPSETLTAAIVRTTGLIPYFGLESTQIESEDDMLEAAALVQALIKIAFFVQRDPDSIEEDGSLDMLKQQSLNRSRGLFYGSDNDTDALVFQAGYAGRALSTVFSGDNTTQDMHLKTIAGTSADPSMTQTLLNKCQAAGADCYPSLEGDPGVFCSGENYFFDRIYNSLWFASAIQINGYNYLKQTATKVAQTEDGMDGLKGAYREVCEQAKTNQYCAPGAWNSPTIFGNQIDLIQNVAQRGYYIYSKPIGLQSQVDRAARKAPLVQIALKEAGSINSSTVIVNVNP